MNKGKEKKETEQKAPESKSYRVDQKILPKGVKVFVSKGKVEAEFNFKFKSEEHAQNFDVVKELTAIREKIDHQRLNSAIRILLNKA